MHSIWQYSRSLNWPGGEALVRTEKYTGTGINRTGCNVTWKHWPFTIGFNCLTLLDQYISSCVERHFGKVRLTKAGTHSKIRNAAYLTAPPPLHTEILYTFGLYHLWVSGSFSCACVGGWWDVISGTIQTYCGNIIDNLNYFLFCNKCKGLQQSDFMTYSYKIAIF